MGSLPSNSPPGQYNPPQPQFSNQPSNQGQNQFNPSQPSGGLQPISHQGLNSNQVPNAQAGGLPGLRPLQPLSQPGSLNPTPTSTIPAGTRAFQPLQPLQPLRGPNTNPLPPLSSTNTGALRPLQPPSQLGVAQPNQQPPNLINSLNDNMSTMSISGTAPAINQPGLKPLNTPLNAPKPFNSFQPLNPMNTGVDPQVNPQMNLVNPQINPQMNPQINPQLNPQMNPQINPQLNPQMNSQMNPQLNPQMNTQGYMQSTPHVIPSHVIPCPPSLMTACYNSIAASRILHSKAQIPQGIIIKPFGEPELNETPIPLVNYGSTEIVRCTNCRAYISCFTQFLDNGKLWKCNFCLRSNTVAQDYFAQLDGNGVRVDAPNRPELTYGAYEIIATSDYMVRNPMPPSYYFVIDVSANAIRNGLVAAAAQAIATAIPNLPGDNRTRIGFLTFDKSIHLYSFIENVAMPVVHVLPDLDDLFLPVPDNLLVNLAEHKEQIIHFLSVLPNLYANTVVTDIAPSCAITVAADVIRSIGGKISLFTTNIDTIGPKRIIPRDFHSANKAANTEHDQALLKPVANSTLQATAISLTRFQISADVYAFGKAQSIELSTLGDLAKFSGSQLQFYPTCNTSALYHDVVHALTRPQGWESVVRMRCTQGVLVKDMYGHFALRGTDLIVLPSVDTDKALTIEINVDEAGTIGNTRTVCIQGALLYTTSEGQRRIRVYTIALPIVNTLQEILASANPKAMVNLLAKQAIPVSIFQSLSTARRQLLQQGVNIMRMYKNTFPQAPNFGNLSYLPSLINALTKTMAFRDGIYTHPDVRAYYISRITTMGIKDLELLTIPTLYGVYPITDNAGTSRKAPGQLPQGPDDVILPPETPLSHQALYPNVAYLISNGHVIYFRIPANAQLNLYQDLFNGPQDAQLPSDQIHLRALKSETNIQEALTPLGRIHSIIKSIRAKSNIYQPVMVFREGDPIEIEFFALLVESGFNNSMSLEAYAKMCCE